MPALPSSLHLFFLLHSHLSSSLKALRSLCFVPGIAWILGIQREVTWRRWSHDLRVETDRWTDLCDILRQMLSERCAKRSGSLPGVRGKEDRSLCVLLPCHNIFPSCLYPNLCISIRSCLLVLLFRFSTSLLTFCLRVLSTIEKDVLTSTRIEDLSIYPFSSLHFCFIYFETVLLGAIRCRTIISSWWTDFFIILKYYFYLWKCWLTKYILHHVNIATLAFLFSICVEYLYLYFHFPFFCVPVFNMRFM